MYENLRSPSILVDLPRLEANLAAMQDACNAAGIELRPHIKTHKMVEVARRQLDGGAAGLTCAKIGEAEAILPAFEGRDTREMFIAHSIVDPLAIPRLQRLDAELSSLQVACTSELHAPVLADIVSQAGLKLQVVMALDTGLGREGARDLEGAVRLAQIIDSHPHLELHALYTHEGHFYGIDPDEVQAHLESWHQYLLDVRGAVEKALGGKKVRLWPGSSVTARRATALQGIDAVRPGAYVFGDLSMTDTTRILTDDKVALHVLATCVDRPAPGLALLDSGSKTFSSDRTAKGILGRSEFGEVIRVNEEHGYLAGPRVDELKLGQRFEIIPAHVCAVVNLTDTVVVVRDGEVIDTWNVEARGKIQ